MCIVRGPIGCEGAVGFLILLAGIVLVVLVFGAWIAGTEAGRLVVFLVVGGIPAGFDVLCQSDPHASGGLSPYWFVPTLLLFGWVVASIPTWALRRA